METWISSAAISGIMTTPIVTSLMILRMSRRTAIPIVGSLNFRQNLSALSYTSWTAFMTLLCFGRTFLKTVLEAAGTTVIATTREAIRQ